jgi:hypothetical protein
VQYCQGLSVLAVPRSSDHARSSAFLLDPRATRTDFIRPCTFYVMSLIPASPRSGVNLRNDSDHDPASREIQSRLFPTNPCVIFKLPATLAPSAVPTPPVAQMMPTPTSCLTIWEWPTHTDVQQETFDIRDVTGETQVHRQDRNTSRVNMNPFQRQTRKSMFIKQENESE